MDRGFSEAAQEVLRLCAQFLEDIDSRRVFPDTSGARTVELFGGACPDAGLGASALEGLRDLVEHSRALNGRALGYVLGSGEPIAALGDLVASVINQNATAWRSSPAAVTIERTVVRWLAEAVGCPDHTGYLVGGGSSANLIGLAMARERSVPANERGARPGFVDASDQVHMSIPRAMALLGLGREPLRVLAADSQHRLRPEDVGRAIRTDRSAGRTPIAIVASAGTVATGAIDPLHELAAVAREHGLWLHVDGAYGALAAIARPDVFAGLAECDSLSLDAHKWLFQPVDCGCVLYRDAELARRTFSHHADYAQVLSDDPIEGFAFFDESPELSRRFRALKLWLSLRYHGLGAFRSAIASNLEVAALLGRLVDEHPRLERHGPAELSAVCFRYVPEEPLARDALDALNAELLRRINRAGRVFLSNAHVDGVFCLRACIANHRTTAADAEAIVSEVVTTGEAL